MAEAHSYAVLRRARLGNVEFNVLIVDEHGRVVFVADVLWRTLRAVLEIDGAEYHLDRADWHSTVRRHLLLSTDGLSVVHFPPSVARLPGWEDDVRRWLVARALELGASAELQASGRDGSTARRGVVIDRAGPEPFVVPGLRSIR